MRMSLLSEYTSTLEPTLPWLECRCHVVLKSAGAACLTVAQGQLRRSRIILFPIFLSSPAHRFGVIYFLHNAPNQSQVNGFSDLALFFVIYFLKREIRGKFSCRLEAPDFSSHSAATTIHF
ncbi:hypothetical protein [Rhizobium sp.]|uniref:hypothetical protein n=1 Tax=Rhizobium sp. TaxID=391 RepID=UPI0028A8C11B